MGKGKGRERDIETVKNEERRREKRRGGGGEEEEEKEEEVSTILEVWAIDSIRFDNPKEGRVGKVLIPLGAGESG